MRYLFDCHLVVGIEEDQVFGHQNPRNVFTIILVNWDPTESMSVDVNEEISTNDRVDFQHVDIFDWRHDILHFFSLELKRSNKNLSFGCIEHFVSFEVLLQLVSVHKRKIFTA